MQTSIMTIGERSVSVFFPEGCMDCPVIYMHFAMDVVESMVMQLSDRKVILVAVDGVDWDAELTPWPAPKLYPDRNDFAGGADVYLRELTGTIVPAVERKLGIMPGCRSILGFSLAGLFAIYALYRTNIFQCAASISGSLWYDGFLDFMKKNHPPMPLEKVYMSLGNHEKETKNRRIASVDQCTIEAEKFLQGMAKHSLFEINAGNHFSDVPGRVVKGIKWIL